VGGGSDLAERSAVVSGARVVVVAELAALDVGHVAQEHEHEQLAGGGGRRALHVGCGGRRARHAADDARLEVVAVLHEAAGAELEVVAIRGGGGGGHEEGAASRRQPSSRSRASSSRSRSAC
jgi:hypothetical protein